MAQANRNQKNSGRRRTGRSAENIERVRNAIELNPSCIRNGLGLSPATFNRITRQDLNFHSHVMKRRHELKDIDFLRRMAYSEWLVTKFQEEDFLRKIVIGDEAAFIMFQVTMFVGTRQKERHQISIMMFRCHEKK